MSSNRRRFAPALLLLLPISIAAVTLSGAEEAVDPIAARQKEMEGVNAAFKPLVGIVRKQAPFDAKVVAEKAGLIAGHLERAKSLFPEGSGQGAIETWAKASIWEQRADFDARMLAGHSAAVALSKVTDEAAYAPAFGKLGEACKGCHEGYRRPKS